MQRQTDDFEHLIGDSGFDMTRRKRSQQRQKHRIVRNVQDAKTNRRSHPRKLWFQVCGKQRTIAWLTLEHFPIQHTRKGDEIGQLGKGCMEQRKFR